MIGSFRPAGIPKAEPAVALLSGERIGQDEGGWLTGIIARTVVPAPGLLSMSSLPPRSVARSRIVFKPKCPGKALSESNPTPLS